MDRHMQTFCKGSIIALPSATKKKVTHLLILRANSDEKIRYGFAFEMLNIL